MKANLAGQKSAKRNFLKFTVHVADVCTWQENYRINGVDPDHFISSSITFLQGGW